MMHKNLLGMGGLGTNPGSMTHVPDEAYEVPLDKAAVVREGSDITLVGLGVTTHHAVAAAKALAKEGVSAEVIDLRAIAPLDRETVRASVRKTGRLVVVDDDYESLGVSAEVIAAACEDRTVRWKSAPRRVAFPDVPIPFSAVLEQGLLPDTEKLLAEARRVLAEDYR